MKTNAETLIERTMSPRNHPQSARSVAIFPQQSGGCERRPPFHNCNLQPGGKRLQFSSSRTLIAMSINHTRDDRSGEICVWELILSRPCTRPYQLNNNNSILPTCPKCCGTFQSWKTLAEAHYSAFPRSADLWQFLEIRIMTDWWLIHNLCHRYRFERLRDSVRAAGRGARVITQPFKTISGS